MITVALDRVRRAHSSWPRRRAVDLRPLRDRHATGVDADRYRAAGTLLARIFLVQIFFYGATASPTALNARRRFFAAAWARSCRTSSSSPRCCRCPIAGDGGLAARRVLNDDRLRWTLGLGATAGIAAMALVLVPALRRPACASGFAPSSAIPRSGGCCRCRRGHSATCVANQVGDHRRPEPRRAGPASLARTPRRTSSSSSPTVCSPISIATTFPPDCSRRRPPRPSAFIDRSSLGVRLIALVIAAVWVRSVRSAAAHRRRGPRARRSSPPKTLSTRLGRLAGFALGLVGFSVYLFVLRVFYAARTPARRFSSTSPENLLNVVLALIFVSSLGSARSRACRSPSRI